MTELEKCEISKLARLIWRSEWNDCRDDPDVLPPEQLGPPQYDWKINQDQYTRRAESLFKEIIITNWNTPPGFVLVPVEPTEAMIDAADLAEYHQREYARLEIRREYKAMLAASEEKKLGSGE